MREPAAARDWPRICVVGPLPPPSGGMANQCEQLVRLLKLEGASVRMVRTNLPCRPDWIGRVPILRAVFRIAPFLICLWREVGQSAVVHVFANSGWAWHLFALPALRIARIHRVPVIVNYRGGLADEFLRRAPRHVERDLKAAALRITPSVFLQRVFHAHGLDAEIVPNIIDLSRFQPRKADAPGSAPHFVVTRNLEAIYDIPTALRAFAVLRQTWPDAQLTVAGSGPELARLQSMALELGIDRHVTFPGRIDNAHIVSLYQDADVMLNPTTADNMPISILEALACGVPVVTTDAGGIPDLVSHERSALIVPVGDATAMAAAARRLIQDPTLCQRLRGEGLALVRQFSWQEVRRLWQDAYNRAAASGHGPGTSRGEVCRVPDSH